MSFQAYLDTIEEKTQKTPRALVEEAATRGYDAPGTKAAEIVAWLKEEYGLGRGHAMALVHVIRNGAQISSKHVGTGSTHRDDSTLLHLDGVGRARTHRRYRRSGRVLIVCGHLIVDAIDRDTLLIESAAAVRLAREAPGCLDFAVSADPVDPERVNVLERWSTPADLKAFRTPPEDGAPGPAPVDFSRSALRLSGAMLIEQNVEWLVCRRYLSDESMRLILDAPTELSISLPDDEDKEGLAALAA